MQQYTKIPSDFFEGEGDIFCKAKRDISDDAICCPRATRCNANPFSRAVRQHIACITHIANSNGIYIAKQKICYPFGQQILLFYKELVLDSCIIRPQTGKLLFLCNQFVNKEEHKQDSKKRSTYFMYNR